MTMKAVLATGGLLLFASICPAEDFDGDWRSEMAVWRPSSGTWFVLTSSSNWNPSAPLNRQWGTTGDLPIMNADFDGDGKADMAVWRPSSGTWFVLTSSSGWNTSAPLIRHWGTTGDIPVVGDFDGDGKADMAVWRPSNGTWYILTSSSNWNTSTPLIRQWGTVGDQPIINTDFDGDGKADIAVWRPSTGTWYVLTSSSNWNTGAPLIRQWGTPGDQPIMNSDFDGDGKADMAVWRPSNGTWFVLTSSSNWSTSAPLNRQWGTAGDHPIMNADFDGDGKADMAVWRPSSGTWFVLTSSSNWNAGAPLIRQWGTGGDQPIMNADFDGDGKTDMAVWRPSNGTWFVLTSSSNWNSGTPLNRQWGTAGDQPIAGDWLRRRRRVRVVNMIPSSLSGESNQDSEPFLAVQTSDLSRMAASAFTPNPAGSSSTTAPIYVTSNGGSTWSLNNIVLSQAETSDITESFDGVATLQAGILRRPGGLLLNLLNTTNFLGSAPMTVNASRNQIDQPFVRAYPSGTQQRVYAGDNDFATPNPGKTATVDISLNGGATFTSARIEKRTTCGQNGPSIRPAAARDGVVYAGFFGWRNCSTLSSIQSDVVVVRDDSGATGTNPFTSLLGAGGVAGQIVASVTIPWSNAPTLGQERIGSTLSVAVAPQTSSTVYVGWGDRVGTGDIYTLHVRRSLDKGVTWSQDLRALTNATNIALAIADNGTVGLLYQQLVGTGAGQRWVTRLEQSKDGFVTHLDTVLANVPATTPPLAFLPYLGDYDFLLAAGAEFRGIFSANNTPDLANFPSGVVYQRNANFTTKTLLNSSGGAVAVSIDPFYFSVPVVR